MHTQRPHPARRRFFALLIITLGLLIPSTTAHADTQDLFESYATRGEIHIDTALLHRRAALSSEPLATASSPVSPSSATSATASGDVALPAPFDTSLGSNFTASTCPTFFNSFLTNSTFSQCTPLSLLLQNSQGFMAAQRAPTQLKAIMDAACAAPISICAATMTDIARQLTLDTHCGADFRARQPLVIQAYNGLLGYEAVATSTCLKTTNYNGTAAPSTSLPDDDDDKAAQYCFTAALTNRASPSDPFPYYTAIGMNLPSVATPTCNGCLKAAMQVFAQWAVKSEQPLSMTYLACAQTVDAVCGAGFADTNVKVGSVNSGSGMKNTQPEQVSAASARGGVRSAAVWGVAGAALAALAVL
ncbi:uncharacterized protein HMPREF1541_07880 [Cyphellophora europaea CBS 101466]|uniref:DUF7729 domain-containing protein n=1 Tax=Cyphellophora europaea (strain CBS 101466) TaxID=1220924 RepID=W2RMI0_CYPE1|nr:uncharacterized protein HMPREF1541_07880 [Cyphellophora europaea CBS 101466]ETN36893.1 hypothetical protein HMPREF1541_07880 [Cyphellophora europaea CBS 101466]